MATQDFVAELLLGHKGAAVLVPFDPGKVWGTRPVEHGVLPWRTGHLVRGAMNGVPFEGWIGRRWGRFFILVDSKLQAKAGIAVGDMVQVVVEPRAGEGRGDSRVGARPSAPRKARPATRKPARKAVRRGSKR